MYTVIAALIDAVVTRLWESHIRRAHMAEKQSLTLLDPSNPIRLPFALLSAEQRPTWVVAVQPGKTGPWYLSEILISLRQCRRAVRQASSTVNTAILLLTGAGVYQWIQ